MSRRKTLVGIAVVTLFISLPCIAICPADVNADGTVGIPDLLEVLHFWGEGSGTSDFTGPGGTPDGMVDIHDLLGVLQAWGPCPER